MILSFHGDSIQWSLLRWSAVSLWSWYPTRDSHCPDCLELMWCHRSHTIFIHRALILPSPAHMGNSGWSHCQCRLHPKKGDLGGSWPGPKKWVGDHARKKAAVPVPLPPHYTLSISARGWRQPRLRGLDRRQAMPCYHWHWNICDGLQPWCDYWATQEEAKLAIRPAYGIGGKRVFLSWSRCLWCWPWDDSLYRHGCSSPRSPMSSSWAWMSCAPMTAVDLGCHDMTGWGGGAITVPWGVARNVPMYDSQQRGGISTVGENRDCCAWMHPGDTEQFNGADWRLPPKVCSGKDISLRWR
jgi:hypothetical protein